MHFYEQSLSSVAMIEYEENQNMNMRDNDTIIRKIRADGNKLCPGKEWRLYA